MSFLRKLFGRPNVEKLKAKRDVQGLIDVLREFDDEETCSRAAAALGELGDPRAVEPLVQALKPVLGFMRGLSMAAADALGRLGDARAVQPLIDCLNRNELDPKLAELLRLKKVIALRGSGRPLDAAEAEARDWVREEFTELLWTVRAEATMALGELRNAKAIEALTLALLDDSPLVAMNAADAIAKIGAAAVEPLIASLEHRRAGVRRGAARALGQIRDPRATEALKRVAGDEDGEVRAYAAAGLGQGRWRPPMDALVAEFSGQMDLHLAAGPWKTLVQRYGGRQGLLEHSAAALETLFGTKYGLSVEEIRSVSVLVSEEIHRKQAAAGAAEAAAQSGGGKQCLSCRKRVEFLRHTCPHCGGEAFAQAGTPEEAVAMLDAMQKQAEAKEHVDRAAQLLFEGSYVEAETELRAAIAINPLNATAHANMGGVFLRLERPGEAIPWLEKALELNPRIEGVSQALAQARAAQGAAGSR
jgi:HEAT repeat protein